MLISYSIYGPTKRKIRGRRFYEIDSWPGIPRTLFEIDKEKGVHLGPIPKKPTRKLVRRVEEIVLLRDEEKKAALTELKKELGIIKGVQERVETGRGRVPYSKEDLLFFGAHLWPVTSNEWNTHMPGTGVPGYQTIRDHFGGSWENFRKEIEDGFAEEGIEFESLESRTSSREYSRGDLIEIGLHMFPTTSTVWTHTRGLPSYTTVERHFGSWNNFREAVESELSKGRTPNPEFKPDEDSERKLYTTRYTKKQLINYGLNVWPISGTEWEQREDLPSAGTIYKRFGTWANFAEAVKSELSKGTKPKAIGKIRSAELEELVIEALDSGRFDGDTYALHHITEQLREETHDGAISVKSVYDTIPNKRRGSIKFEDSQTGLDRFFFIRDFLSGLDEKQLAIYGQPAGTYFLARDLRAVDEGSSFYLKQVNSLVKDKKHVEDLLGRKLLEIEEWKPRDIDLRFEDAEIIIDLLREKYKEDPNTFFSRYGAKEGSKTLISDLKRERDLDLNAKKIHSLVADVKTLLPILGIDDPRFETEWKPRTIYLDNNESNLILGHLRERYQHNPDKFFEVYGSEVGGLLLAIELEQIHQVNISPARISSLTRQGKTLERLLEVEDVRFRREWRPKNVQVSLGGVQSLVNFMRGKYQEDPDEFYSRYGSDIGALNLSRDLAEQGINIPPSNVQTIAGKGEFVSLLLGIKDERLNNWRQRRMVRDLSLVDVSVKLLREAYESDPDGFFVRYGSQEGIRNLALDLMNSGRYDKRIDLNELARLYGKSSVAREVTGLTDERFETGWRPRQLHIHSDILEDVLEFLRREYQEDSDGFFGNYGGPAGTYRLAKKLKEMGVNLHLTKIGTVVNKGEFLSRILGIEDERFETDWRPRSLQMKLEDLDIVLNFLREKYQEDPGGFFSRYGVKEGQITLGRDLEEETGKSIGYLHAVVGNGLALSELLEVKDERFKTDWKTQVVINSSFDRNEYLLDFMKRKYQENPDGFFSRYGRKSGALEVARDLHKEKKINVQLDYLHTLIGNGKKLAIHLEVEDKRFESDWEPAQLRGKFSHLERILDFIREKHAEDPDEFSHNYGSAGGSIALVTNMESEGYGKIDLRNLSYLINPEILKQQLGITSGSLIPMRVNMNSDDAKRVMEYLRAKYEQDPSMFFEIYGSRLGNMILSREMGLSDSASNTLDSLVNNGRRLGEALDIEDERFRERWSPRIPRKSEGLALRGIESIAQGRDLPEISEPIDERIIEYLTFRSRILRGLSRGSGAGSRGSYNVSYATNKHLVLLLTNLFLPQHSGNVERFIDLGLKTDTKELEELTSTEIPCLEQSQSYNVPSKATEARRLRYEEGLSWEEISSRLGVTKSTAKNYAAIGRREDSKENETLVIPEVQSIEGMPLDQFTLKAGKLLYSFDPEIRTEGYSMLAQVGAQHSQYRHDIANGGDRATIAQEVFETVVARYDPYLPFYKGENKVLSLLKWLSGNFKFVRHIARARKGREISIDTGGFEDDRMYEGRRPLQEYV